MDVGKLAELGRVCKRWLRAARHPDLWQALYFARFPMRCLMQTSSARSEYRQRRGELETTDIENCDNPRCPQLYDVLSYASDSARRCPVCGRHVPLLPAGGIAVDEASGPFAVAQQPSGHSSAVPMSYLKVGGGLATTVQPSGGSVGFYWGQDTWRRRWLF
eukprot:m51a1_g13588 hypothetical protein (161) ;mRNA; f:450-1024